MRHLVEIAGTGLAAIRLHPLRSSVSIIALVVVLLPYLIGLGLSQGIEAEAEASARLGADLYVRGSQFGRPVPIPRDAEKSVRAIDGVTDVVARIVGEVVLGKDRVHGVLVGLPADKLTAWTGCIDGDLPKAGRPHQLVVGTALARLLGLKVGSPLRPFYRNDRGEFNSLIVGVFKPDAPLWQANLILTTLDSAAYVFDQPGLATDLLVSCRPGYQAAVTRAIVHKLSWRVQTAPGQPGIWQWIVAGLASPEGKGVVRARIVAREDLLALLPQGLLHREGVFNLHFVLVFVVGILVLLVTSGLGLAERRREIGILKATGWQTDEILLRGTVESFCLSLAGACIALLLAWVWLRVFNGYGVAGFFLAGVGPAPDFPVPFRLTPVPAVLAFVLSFVIVWSGTLYSSWRAATAPPREVIR